MIRYSGGCYHITVNGWDSRVAHHLMSKDDVNDWKNMGVAYDPRASFVRYADGAVNQWNNLERPNVVIENGHVRHFTFAATDIDKSSTTGTRDHGSKILVVPSDGVAFDDDNGREPAARPLLVERPPRQRPEARAAPHRAATAAPRAADPRVPHRRRTPIRRPVHAPPTRTEPPTRPRPLC